MCNWNKWIIPGLIAVGLLTALAGWLRSGPVEADLTARSGAALSANHPWASVALEGRDLVLSGVAPAPEAATDALKLATATYGVRIASDTTSLLPLAEPYLFSANRDGNKVILTGTVPGENIREELRAQILAAIPGAEIDDQLTLARGAPDGFGALAGFGLGQLAQLNPATISTKALELSVSGTAATVEAWNSIKAALEAAVPGGGKVVLADISPASVSPYIWAYSRDGDVVTLTGYAPGTAERDAAATQAATAFPGARIVNRLGVAGGVPAGFDWSAASGFALGQLNQLSKGKASVNNNELSVEGLAVDATAFDGVNATLAGALPGGLKLAANTVTNPPIVPYVWSLTRPGNGTSMIEGYVPDKKTAAANLESASASNPDSGQVTDKQKTGAGAPPNFGAATSVAIFNVNRLISGNAEIIGTELNVSGEALSQFAADSIATQVKNGVPPGWTGNANIKVRPLAPQVTALECQAVLDAILKGKVINFETSSAAIKPDSFGLLDRLVYSVARCPDARVQIAGHTDSDGSDSDNQLLSDNRSISVIDYLVASGAAVGRFEPKGFGETQPLADNATAEGKATNRRIEFRVIQ